MGAPRITAVVPVKDRRERMLRCLDALLAQDHPNYDVIVVDNGSTDGTPEACRQRAAGSGVPVRVVVMEGTLGAIRNRAAAMAEGEFVAYTDSDCIPDPGWLSAHAEALAGDPGLGVTQGRTLPECEPDRGWPATIRVEAFSNRYETCNVAYRREALLAAGGFDEVIGYYWEDTVAGFAVRRLGWRAAWVPAALVHHDVTYPGFWWHARRMQAHRNLAAVVGRDPTIRDLLFLRLFIAPRDLRFRGLLAGLLLGFLDRRALWLAAPYLVTRVKDDGRLALRPTVLNPKSHAHALIYDASRTIGVWRGALAERVFLP